MIRCRNVVRWMACALALAVWSATAGLAQPDELHVMVSGGFTAAYNTLSAEWEKASGRTIATVFGPSMGATPQAIPNRLARGEAADVVILARSALDALVADGRAIKGSEVDLVRSRIAMAVKAGSPIPDISTEARFTQALLDATSVAYSDSASGVYLSTVLFPRLGIAERMAAKSRMIAGTPVGDVVARGDAAIGFQQTSELLPISGITIVGPIPDGMQLVTVFSAGIATSSRHAETARQLIAYLSSDRASPAIRAAGLDPIRHAAAVPRK